MCGRTGRDRLCDPALRRFVAGSAVGPHVLCVVESRPETSQPRETLHPTGLRIRMADGTHRTGLIGKLQSVTAGTRKMTRLTRKADSRGIRVAAMAEQTREPRVKLIAVLKPRVIDLLGRIDGRGHHEIGFVSCSNNLGQRIGGQRKTPKQRNHSHAEKPRQGPRPHLTVLLFCHRQGLFSRRFCECRGMRRGHRLLAEY